MTTMRSANRHGRHVQEDGRRPSLRRIRIGVRVTPGRIAASAVAILLGVFGAAGAAAGSFAYLNATASTTAGSTITAGTGTLTLQQGATAAGTMITFDNTVWNHMLPGDFVGQTMTITNTGDAQLIISNRLSNAIAWEIRVAAGACPASLLATSALTIASTVLSPTPLAPGAAQTVCVQASLPAAAVSTVQGSTPAFTLIVDGVQSA